MKFRLLENNNSRDFDKFSIEIPYDKLNIEIATSYSPAWWDGFRGVGGPEEWDTVDDVVEWDYEIDWSDFSEVAAEEIINDEEFTNKILKEFGKEDLANNDDELYIFFNSQEFDNWMYDHADEIMDRYIERFRTYFEDSARERAEEYHQKLYDEEPDDYEPDYYDD